MNYNVTLVESDEGWAVWCDSLPGCCSQGATREEALANIREAISEYQMAQQVVNEEELGVHSIQHETVTIRSMPKLPGIGQKQAVRVLEKRGFRVVR